MPSPLVSIIVNSYNRADMICTALDSVWAQTYRPLELIVVDDGSRDNSMEVIEAWKKAHPDSADFTTVARTFPNGKLCVARNRGLAMAHGELVQYVDDDDWLYPNTVAEKVKYYHLHPDCDLIVNQLDFFRNGCTQICTHISLPENPEHLIAHLLSHECLISAVLMFRRETLERIGAWREGLIFADDMEICLRLAILSGKIGLIDKSLSGCRVHNQVRQCTTVRDKLSDTFHSELYCGLWDLCGKHGKDTPENQQAFTKKLEEDAVDLLHHKRLHAAINCLKAAEQISGEKSKRLRWSESPLFSPLLQGEVIFWSLFNTGKQVLKKIRKAVLNR